MQRDSVSYTLLVATVLCVVCSLLVSGAAEFFKEQQETNREVDKKKNILLAARLCESDASKETVDEIYSKMIEEEMVELGSAKTISESELPAGYKPEKAAKDPELQVAIEPPSGLMGIKQREPYAPVYKIMKEGKLDGYIMPIYGKGLWSTLYGFLAVEADRETVKGITYYKHGETPGLGGEVDNPSWKSVWPGKKVYEASGEVGLSVIKGKAAQDAKFAVDGLSGATITSKGVDLMIEYWLGEEGFGPYLKSQGGVKQPEEKSEH